MISRFSILLLGAALSLSGTAVFGQEGSTSSDNKRQERPNNRQNPTDATTAEQVAESSIIIYGGFQGRQNLNQIRKTTIERGKTVLTDGSGRKDSATYERIVIRGESLEKEKIRVDQSFPSQRFALIYNAAKIFGIYNESVFVPRDDASTAFRNQIWHSIEAFLRYKENESKLELAGRDKIMGVDFYLVDMTDKASRKTRFYVSVRSLRVMMLEYESDGQKYRRKFYDYNYAQGTLVPYRSVLFAGDREIEETKIGTITFGQRVEDALFNES